MTENDLGLSQEEYDLHFDALRNAFVRLCEIEASLAEMAAKVKWMKEQVGGGHD